jgi:membrane associated rhomboid family serine protease
MSKGNHEFDIRILYPTFFIIFLWLIKLFEILSGITLYKLGVLPRHVSGLIGILTYPLIHASISHLLSNSLPFLILGTGLVYFYKESALKVFFIIYFGSGILVWLFARTAYHIGCSGIIYGFGSFLFFSGLIRRDSRAIVLALLVTFLYGSLVWGFLPLDASISWESHVFGALIGVVCSFVFRKRDVYKRYDWEDEPDDEDGHNLEISYDDPPPDEWK